MRIVQKYGGTSLGDEGKIRLAARRMTGLARQGAQVVAVVSAQGQLTDELIEKGYFTDKNALFNSLLSPEGGYYVPSERFKSLEIIGYLDSIGAVPVWAHPFLDMHAKEIDAFLPIAKAHGLVGMETRYSLYNEETQKTAEMLAEKHGIKQSGGSDFHGSNKPGILLGTGKGNLEVPIEFYENLKK